MKYTHIIWDFNGTILDDIETGIKSINTLLLKRGLKTLDGVHSYREAFGFPIRDYYEKVGFDFGKESFDAVAHEWVVEYGKNVKSATLFDDVKSTIELFKNAGLTQTVLSATEINMLKSQLYDLSVLDYFDEIYGLDNIHAASKISLACEWREKHPTANALMLGDTVHDAETAKVANADCVLIARGHQSKEKLYLCGVPVLDSLAEATKMIFY